MGAVAGQAVLTDGVDSEFFTDPAGSTSIYVRAESGPALIHIDSLHATGEYVSIPEGAEQEFELLQWGIKHANGKGDGVASTITFGTTSKSVANLDFVALPAVAAAGDFTFSCFEDGASIGNIGDVANRDEVSGMAMSVHPDNIGTLLLVDDDDSGVIYLMSSSDASDVGELQLTGASWLDAEEIGVGKHPTTGVDYFFVAEIGNNAGTRTDLSIFRVIEPTFTGGDVVIAANDIEQITFVYDPAGPDGEQGGGQKSRNAEIFFVDPLTGDMYIVDKELDPPNIFRLAYQDSYTGQQTFLHIGELGVLPADIGSRPDEHGVGGTISPDGLEILIKGYNDVYLWQRPDTSTSIGDLLQQRPTNAAVNYVGFGTHPTGEPQGEALCFDEFGVNYFTMSESKSPGSGADNAPVFEYDRCADLVYLNLSEGENGYTGTKDTYLSSVDADTGLGDDINMIVDADSGTTTRQGLIRFDLSGVPAGSTIFSAVFDFFTVNEGAGMDFYSMLEDWDETITHASNGNAIMLFNDVEAESTAFANWPGDPSAPSQHYQVTLPVSVIQGWVDDPATNFGWVLEPTHATNGQQLATSEHTDQNVQPRLELQYFPPGVTVPPVPVQLVLQDGSNSYTGELDTFLTDVSPATPRNTEVTFIVDQQPSASADRQGLLIFDLTETGNVLPTNATITAVELDFDVTNEGQGMDGHVMLEAWAENITHTSNGGLMAIDDVEATTAVDWNWPGDDGFTGHIQITLPTATIQAWLASPSTNFGWLILGTDEVDGQQLASRRETTQADRPKLTITYTLP